MFRRVENEPNAGAEESTRHFVELVEGFETAMLVTRTSDGQLRARPLSVAAVDPDGVVYFSTNVESPKADEIEADARVVVTFQKAKKYASLSGTAHLSRERTLVERLWKEDWKVWFPAGPRDPSLAIVIVRPTAAEYWDQTGIAGMKYAFRALKAYLTGTKAPDAVDPAQNAKVPLG
jgi:general stress protein 26